MTNRYVFNIFFVSAVIGLWSAGSAQACDEKIKLDEAQIKSELVDLSLHQQNATLFNFRDGKCEPLSDAHTDADISAFVPKDETSQGLYSLYRHRGEEAIPALRDVYQFISSHG